MLFLRSSITALIKMESMATSIVRFKGLESNVYLCMDDKGVCYAKVSVTLVKVWFSHVQLRYESGSRVAE